MTDPMLVVRADATPVTGAGHAMRCLNVVECWLEAGYGGAVVAGEIRLSFVAQRLGELGIAIRPARPLPHGSLLLVDSYDASCRRECAAARGFRARVLVDDQGGDLVPGYDAVWNPNAFGDRRLYPDFEGVVLTGADSVPIRARLPRWTGGGAGAIGVAVGGSRLPAPIRAAFVRLARREPGPRFCGSGDWVPDGWIRTDPTNPWSRLAECDAVVVGAGISLWEAAAVGVPCVVMRLADNQDRGAEWARSAGCPVVDAETCNDADGLADALAAALPRARPLPEVRNSSDRVARWLRALSDGPPHAL